MPIGSPGGVEPLITPATTLTTGSTSLTLTFAFRRTQPVSTRRTETMTRLYVDYALTHKHFTKVEIKVHPQLDYDHKPISYKSSALKNFTTPNFKILRGWEGIANEIQHISWP